MELTTTLALGGAVLLTAYLFFRHRYTYWERKGVPFPKPTLVVGNFGFIIAPKEPIISAINSLAAPFKDTGYCGVYKLSQPVLLVWRPELVKQIVCKDFGSFHDRGLTADERDPLSQHLFNLGGSKWRNLRNRLSPTFTSGKLKLMFPLMRDIGDELVTQVAKEAKLTDEVELGGVLARYATDVIGSVAFGIQCHSLRDGDSEFLDMSQQVFRQTPGQLARFVLEGIHPKLGALLPLKWIISKLHHFFIGLMKDTVEYREKNNVERHDFVQLMMQLRQADLSNADPENHIELTPGVMAAQGFIFFIAGLDNIANTVAFALSKLAVDPEMQDKVAGEVREVLRQHDGEVSYEALKKMDLLNRVVLEALRHWNPIGAIVRKCNASTKVGDVLVDEGQEVIILTAFNSMDEDIFPDPKRFDPERHTREAREQRHPYAFLPFSEGPRICIAERFSMLEMQLALALLIRDFTFAPGPSYEHEPELDKRALVPRPINGMRLKVAARV